MQCIWTFQKAFDKVSHEKLVLKMKRIGLEDGIVQWIGNWLSDRRQRAVVNGVASGWERVESGVPQRLSWFWGRCFSLFFLMI